MGVGGIRAGLRPLAASASLALVGLLAAIAPQASAATCPNEAIRAEQGAPGLALPECRAYELVSPPGAVPSYQGGPGPGVDNVGPTLASLSGDRLSYYSYYPSLGDSSDGLYFLSTRGQAGWSTVNALPPQSTGDGFCVAAAYFSPELSQEVLTDGAVRYGTEGNYEGPFHPCKRDEPALVPGEPEGGFRNLFFHDRETGAYQLVNLTPPGTAPENASLQDISADFAHVLFSEQAPLLEGAPTATNLLYEWAAGALRLITYLPDGTLAPGQLADGLLQGEPRGGHPGERSEDQGAAPFAAHPVSADGERVFFYAAGSLYLRQNAMQPPSPVEEPEPGRFACTEPAMACTVQLDAVQGGFGTSGGATFLYASADGSRVFFTDQSRLTEDSTAVSEKPDLYEYDLEKPLGQRLTDLTVDHSAPANVLGFSGASEDGSYLYFVAKGALTGAQQNSQGAEAKQGRPNLYLDREGTLTFIATLNTTYDLRAWAGTAEWLRYLHTSVSPNGAFAAFNSVESLTGYNNKPAEPSPSCAPSTACSEVFLYSAAENKLECPSCDPGSIPDQPTAVNPAGFTPFGTEGTLVGRRRDLLDDGQLFFDSAEALLPADVNGVLDVYEYRAGQLHLISSGTTQAESVFDEADPSGNNVFFVTAQPLVRADTGATPSLYDARVEGGFPEPSLSPVCESAEACYGRLPEPPPSTTPATPEFNGPGNVRECPRGFVHRRGRCVKRSKPRKHHKGPRRRAAHRRGAVR